VGLVGKPNTGKSTLLARLSRARPEIAPYPFTTKHPHLGRVRIDRDRSFTMADIPGLIEGASEGAGLGHEFLRHIQRAGILVHLVEPEPADGTDPLENYRAIRAELGQYDPELWHRPEIVVVTKADLPGGETVRRRLADMIAAEKGGSPHLPERPGGCCAQMGTVPFFGEVLLCSAVTGHGLNELVGRIAATLQGEQPW
jgi:GTP-binding protein